MAFPVLKLIDIKLAVTVATLAVLSSSMIDFRVSVITERFIV
jgi:hypothetical protein